MQCWRGGMGLVRADCQGQPRLERAHWGPHKPTGQRAVLVADKAGLPWNGVLTRSRTGLFVVIDGECTIGGAG